MVKKDLEITFEDLYEKLGYISSKEEKEEIRKAYMYAYEKHYGQKRRTGGEYILHPLNVAYILTSIHADGKTIMAALLHEVLKECNVEIEEIEQLFGKEVSFLVEGVSKINRLSFGGDTEAIIASQRKILVGLSEDVRVIFIKLADRLHNMRTLWAIPLEKQKEKAKETLDVLTPIAHRLGMNQIKSELEDLSLRYYKPDVYYSIVEKLNKSKFERESSVFHMIESVSALLNEHKITHEIKGRAKSIYSIYKKLDKGKRFNDIYDLLALRVFVDTKEECYQVLGIVHAKYKPIPKRFKDYVAMPKTNMYQSLHTTVFGEDGNLFEIQIRTYEMDQIAEHGIASHWSYKEKGSNVSANMKNEMEQKLQFFRTIMDLKKEGANEEEFVHSLKEDVFNDTIYVFTPKGDVIELPNGSTPIDFAYKVHSGVGDKMVGAIVNNTIVPFDYRLKDNDIIKINTNKNAIGPSKEWINMAYTTQAKNKIKAFFNKIDKMEYIKRGEELLSKELRKRKLSITEFLKTENISKILEEVKCTDINDVYLAIGSNKITISTIIHMVTDENVSKEEMILKRTQNKEVQNTVHKKDIIVDGIDDIKVNVASCCKPIPGDDIIGYVTKGKGITIHSVLCPNIIDINERLLPVHWNTSINNKYATTILVQARENNNILLDIIAKTSGSDISVQSMNTLTSSGYVLYDMTVLVDDQKKLLKLIGDLETLPSVLSVRRMMK